MFVFMGHCLFVLRACVCIMQEYDWGGGGGVKGLIMTRSNLVVTLKDRPQMNIFSWFPLGLRWFGWVGCILGSFRNWNFNLCQKEEEAKVWLMCNWEISHKRTTCLLRSSSKRNVLMIGVCVGGGDLVTDVTGWFVSTSAAFLRIDWILSCCCTHFITLVYGGEYECWSETTSRPNLMKCVSYRGLLNRPHTS